MKLRFTLVAIALMGLLCVSSTKQTAFAASRNAMLPERLIVSLEASEALHFMDIGVLTSSRYVEVLIDRIERHPEVNAFIHLDPDQALAAAEEADELRDAGEILGPLHGLPVLIKDNIDTVDMATTAGTPSLVINEPDENAPIVQSLVYAGAIILGKANMHELALGSTSNNAFTGAVRNPYDFDLIPGGSSGGNGAALAARFVPVAVGTDTGGSVRIPAALTGTFGFRPTTDRYSLSGIVPISFSLDTAGPMARSIGDVALIDSVLAGEPYEIEPASLDGMRIGAPLEHFRQPLDPAVNDSMNHVLEKLEAAGATIVETAIPNVELTVDVWFGTAYCEYFDALGEYLDEHDLDLTVLDVIDMIASPDVQAVFEQPPPPPEVCDQIADVLVPLLRASYEAYLSDNDLDAVVYPTTRRPAAPIGQDFFVELNGEMVPVGFAFASATLYAPVVGAPAVTIPVGLSDEGLPVGVDVMGAPGSDREVLSIGAAIDRMLGPIHAPPAIEPRALPE